MTEAPKQSLRDRIQILHPGQVLVVMTVLASAFGCFISAAVLRGMANIIRLLKMSNRVPFDGELD
jgi:hypothetical protein